MAVSRLSRYEAFSSYLRRKNVELLNHTGEIKKVLVISDVNIGDAVTIQSCIGALRYHFPNSEIDYAYNLAADPIINRNPEISNTFPIFTSSIRPSERGCSLVQGLCRAKAYDLVINFCPFLSSHDLRRTGSTVISPVGLIAEGLKAKTKQKGTANLAHRISEYMNQLFSEIPEKIPPRKI